VAISSVTELQHHLVNAMKLELTTVPPYLYAMYSIKDHTSNAHAAIRSVVVEEMLHLSLGANLLLAVGGQPLFYSRDFVPSYPGPLPLPDIEPALTIRLQRCSQELMMNTFMVIEKPDPEPFGSGDSMTIGRFYWEIQEGITRLDHQHPTGLFRRNQLLKQLTSGYRSVAGDVWGSGHLITIDGLDAARTAIQYIVRQGEGMTADQYADPFLQERTHYDKFDRIANGITSIGEVWPVVKNPKASEFPEPAKSLCNLFNAAYCYLLVILDRIFYVTNQSEKLGMAYSGLVLMMTRILRPLAHLLVQQPIGGGSQDNAGPSFEYFELDDTRPRQQIDQMAHDLQLSDFPSLKSMRDYLVLLPDVSPRYM